MTNDLSTLKGWCAERWEPGTSYVHPLNDTHIHDIQSDDCACGPYWDFVPATDNRPDGWVLVHYSFDGRERYE